MADKRKSFRARRLVFGRRSLPRLCAVAVFALAATMVQAQEAGLKSGAASLAAGKYQDAVRQLSAAINASNISASNAAKALYLRGIAYRKMGQPGNAVADLGAAIWLGLPQSDRVKAQVNRGLAFKAAGLNSQGEAEIAAARKIGGSREVDQIIADGGGAPKSAESIAAFSTEVSRDGRTSTSASSRSSWFPSLGGGRSESAAPAPQPSPPPTRTASAAPSTTTDKPPAASGSWTTSVEGTETQSSSSSGSGNRLTRWFGSVAGSSSSEPPPAPGTQTAAASPPPSTPRSATSSDSASSNWSTTTQSEQASGASESGRSWRLFGRSAEPEPAAQPAATQSASGGYQLQLANSRSEAEAKALWKKASGTPGLQGTTPQIEKIDIGNFGTFYSLRVGPFPDKAQSVKVCNALKRSGIDCSLATL